MVMQLDDLVTPALIVDRTRLIANISDMAARAGALGVALRPHAKTHKSPAVAALYEEQAIVRSDRACELRIGARLRVVPNHACAVANLHSQMFVVDQDVVVDVWPVATREWRETEADRRPAWSTR
jgi:D-serine deaminase-like pyridoxal phosphate-dependent protein